VRVAVCIVSILNRVRHSMLRLRNLTRIRRLASVEVDHRGHMINGEQRIVDTTLVVS
jgi:hypothetical protein